MRLLLALTALAGVAVSVDRLTVDGLELRTLRCDLTSGGLLAPVAVAGALAAQRPALDACAPTGAAFELSWTWGPTPAHKVVRSSLPAADACVAKALAAAKPAATGTCSGVVLVGDPAAAAKAADALAAPR
jgi:hypothetical protein